MCLTGVSKGGDRRGGLEEIKGQHFTGLRTGRKGTGEVLETSAEPRPRMRLVKGGGQEDPRTDPGCILEAG